MSRQATDVLVNHPLFGSVWLLDAYLLNGHVVGEAWDDHDAGCPFMPDGYMGQPVTMNFPVSCIRKVNGPPPKERAEQAQS